MKFEALFRLLNSFHTAHVLVVGDVMLDRFIYGSVERISPEAPIPVINVDRRVDLPRSLRNQIATKLEKCGVAQAKTGRIRDVVPVERTERLSLYGEAVPPGLILSEF